MARQSRQCCDPLQTIEMMVSRKMVREPYLIPRQKLMFGGLTEFTSDW